MKKRATVIASVLAVAFAAYFAVVCVRVSAVGTFDVNDYRESIALFPSAESVGKVADARDAKQKAEQVWLKHYPDVKGERPYKVSCDVKNDAWLVTGSFGWLNELSFNSHNILGGTACIIMTSDGEVLAVWHEK